MERPKGVFWVEGAPVALSLWGSMVCPVVVYGKAALTNTTPRAPLEQQK